MNLNKKIICSFIFILLLFSTIFSFIIVKKTKQPQVINTSPSPTYPVEDKLLIDYLPDFDHLKLSNLPYFSDVRSVHTYKNHQIIIGANRIIEYDPVDKKIVRINNENLRPMVASGVVIDNMLYFSSSNGKPEYDADRIMTKVDLETGKIIKTYFENPDRSYTNLHLTLKDNTIWGSMWGGAFKFDPTTENFTYFNYKEMGLKEPSCAMYIFNENETITVMSNCYDVGFTTYNEASNTWAYRVADSMDYASKINLQPKDFGLEFPYFLALSNKVQDRYYALTADSIYIIRRNEFPKFVRKITQKQHEYLDTPRLFANKAATELLIAGVNSGPGMDLFKLNEVLVLGLIDINTGVYTNLALHFTQENIVKDDQERQLLLSTLAEGTISDTSTEYKIRFKNPNIHKECIVSIDVNKKIKVEFQSI